MPGTAPCEPWTLDVAVEAVMDATLELDVDSDELADVVVGLVEYRGNGGGGGDETAKG